ncbi:MAG TPA: hypothetical protein VKA15_27060, partial [Isosphaeraceae bacterium]|nr:hypothetical protein [Isosphaeraceae bacterium]
QARKSGGWGGSVGAGLHGTQPDWSGGSGRAAHEWGRSELPADESFGSSDRACKGSLPATVSKREQRRLQCQEEPRTVEKMVEDMLTAGNCAPGEILMSVLKLPLSGGGGP